MNYVNGESFTHLDNYRQYEWPTLFYKVPEIGERVLSMGGERSLKVCGITHCMIKNCDGRYTDERNKIYVRIELHK